jgi:hypothetical protein
MLFREPDRIYVNQVASMHWKLRVTRIAALAMLAGCASGGGHVTEGEIAGQGLSRITADPDQEFAPRVARGGT